MTDGSMDALAGQRVLVTGGAGVIARELLDRLSTAGASVLSVDRLPLPTDPPSGVGHLVADLAFADLEPIARFRPRYVFHLAATFERSVRSPEFWDRTGTTTSSSPTVWPSSRPGSGTSSHSCSRRATWCTTLTSTRRRRLTTASRASARLSSKAAIARA